MKGLSRDVLQHIVNFAFEITKNAGYKGILIKDAEKQLRKLIKKHVPRPNSSSKSRTDG